MANDILVHPVELRIAAEKIRDHAGKIHAALQAVDRDLKSLDTNRFSGFRSNALRNRYNSKRDSLSNMHTLLLKFSDELDTAASVFEKADKEEFKVASEFMPVESSKDIGENWPKMTFDERVAWLENYYKDLCKKLGMDPVEFKVVDLKDPIIDGEQKDWGGYFSPFEFLWIKNKMVIDSTNINGDDSYSQLSDLINTVAHETRHQYQHYLIENPDQRPDNISKETIKSWEENFKNYKKPEDDFEAYRNQPIEDDARNAGEGAAKDFLNQKAGVI